jgi:hypothetical protein
VQRVMAGVTTVLAMTIAAAGCGGTSSGGSGHSAVTAPHRLTVNRVLSTLNTHLQPDHFRIVHRFASGETNMTSDSHTYGSFMVELSASSLDGTSWGKDRVNITPAGGSGNYEPFGFGRKGLRDYVKAYGNHLLLVYTMTTRRAACARGATPHGQGWKLVDQTLTRLAQATV